MKKIFLLWLLFAAQATRAQNITAAQVPSAVKASFSKAHIDAAGTWERDGADYEVNFKEDGKAMSCILDKKGTIVETETSMAVHDLPEAVRNYVRQHYQGSSIKEAAHLVRNDGSKLYEAEVAGRDLLFKEDGTFVKSVKE